MQRLHYLGTVRQKAKGKIEMWQNRILSSRYYIILKKYYNQVSMALLYSCEPQNKIITNSS